MSQYTEDTLVQQTTADYLEKLGWQSVFASSDKDFGPGSLLDRESDREAVLTRTLREKLMQLNSGLPAAAYDDALRVVSAATASQTLAATNQRLPSPYYEAAEA